MAHCVPVTTFDIFSSYTQTGPSALKIWIRGRSKLSLNAIIITTLKWCMGCGNKAPRILNLDNKWKWVGSFTIRPPLHWRKKLPAPIRKNAGWSNELVWTLYRKKKCILGLHWEGGPMEIQCCPSLLQPLPPHTALSDSVHIIRIYRSHNCMCPVVQPDRHQPSDAHVQRPCTQAVLVRRAHYKNCTRHAMYVWRNIGARSRCLCCSGKATKYYLIWVCVCGLRYSACNAHAPCYLVYGLSGCTVFFHIIS
jgi:hypothetical protein